MMHEDVRLKNLTPASERSLEERRENGSKGGKVASENRKKKKLLQELTIELLNNPVDEVVKKYIIKEFPTIELENITNGLALVIAMYKKALQGDIKAFEVLRDTAGEKPGNKLDVSNEDGSFGSKKLEVIFIPPTNCLDEEVVDE